jgi:uncharacterized protein YdhG (YjbR/CyaY superfamily)
MVSAFEWAIHKIVILSAYSTIKTSSDAFVANEHLKSARAAIIITKCNPAAAIK